MRYLLLALIQTENPYLCFVFLWFPHCNFRYRVIGLFFFHSKSPLLICIFSQIIVNLSDFSHKKKMCHFCCSQNSDFNACLCIFCIFAYLIERMDRCMNNVYTLWGYDDGFNPSCSVNQFSSSPTSLCMSAW